MLVDDLVNSAVEESSKMCAWERIRLNNIRERQELFEKAHESDPDYQTTTSDEEI
jgi:hypothetical protein